MREEYGMRWRGLDREMGLNDKLFFVDGEEKRDFIGILTTPALLPIEVLNAMER